MLYELTPDEIHSYQKNGFVVIDNFLTPAELEVWRKVVGEAVAKRGEARMPGEEGKAFVGSNTSVFKQRIQLAVHVFVAEQLEGSLGTVVPDDLTEFRVVVFTDRGIQ